MSGETKNLKTKRTDGRKDGRTDGRINETTEKPSQRTSFLVSRRYQETGKLKTFDNWKTATWPIRTQVTALASL